jgi:CheY-like chemotaxis protein
MNDRKKMLIIDDNSMIRTLLKADFEDEFAVEVAMNGTEGLAAAMRWLPEVILLDINMPDMSGIDVVRRLELGSETKHIPVIIVTASEHNNTTQRQLQPYGNFKGFFSKMTSTDEIRKTVWKVLL